MNSKNLDAKSRIRKTVGQRMTNRVKSVNDIFFYYRYLA